MTVLMRCSGPQHLYFGFGTVMIRLQAPKPTGLRQDGGKCVCVRSEASGKGWTARAELRRPDRARQTEKLKENGEGVFWVEESEEEGVRSCLSRE